MIGVWALQIQAAPRREMGIGEYMAGYDDASKQNGG